VPCQIVTLEKSAGGGGGFLLTCSRGYGDSMLHAVLEAGAEFGLRPAGENRFHVDSRYPGVRVWQHLRRRGKWRQSTHRIDRKRQCAAASSDFSEATIIICVPPGTK
jgi:hypothetical protein